MFHYRPQSFDQMQKWWKMMEMMENDGNDGKWWAPNIELNSLRNFFNCTLFLIGIRIKTQCVSLMFISRFYYHFKKWWRATFQFQEMMGNDGKWWEMMENDGNDGKWWATNNVLNSLYSLFKCTVFLIGIRIKTECVSLMFISRQYYHLKKWWSNFPISRNDGNDGKWWEMTENDGKW